MSCKIGSSLSYVSTSLPSPFQSRRTSPQVVQWILMLQISSRKGSFYFQHFYTQKLKKVQVDRSCQSILGKLKLNKRYPERRPIYCAMPEDLFVDSDLDTDHLMEEEDQSLSDHVQLIDSLCKENEGAGGRPGFISFYNHPYRIEDKTLTSSPGKNQNNLLWLIGPGVLVASFIFPSLYLRRILSTVFEDSLLTDFLILFFTEAIFYCGVAVFLLLIDYLRRPTVPLSSASIRNVYPQLGHRISSVAVLVLSLIIPMVTMGYVWPWTGPAASATLAPYLVGITVQFAFEQYARYTKSPSWPVIPIIFQVYRLHQLNRAAQLVTALSYTVKGAEMTSHNLAISSSLGTLLNVLQFLGVICIWSLSSFIMRLLPSVPMAEQ